MPSSESPSSRCGQRVEEGRKGKLSLTVQFRVSWLGATLNIGVFRAMLPNGRQWKLDLTICRLVTKFNGHSWKESTVFIFFCHILLWEPLQLIATHRSSAFRPSKPPQVLVAISIQWPRIRSHQLQKMQIQKHDVIHVVPGCLYFLFVGPNAGSSTSNHELRERLDQVFFGWIWHQPQNLYETVVGTTHFKTSNIFRRSLSSICLRMGEFVGSGRSSVHHSRLLGEAYDSDLITQLGLPKVYSKNLVQNSLRFQSTSIHEM